MGSFTKSVLPIRVFAKISVRRALRDKTAIFFIFAFPLIFLFIFGGIFGHDSNVSFKIALINNSTSDFSKQFVSDSKNNKLFDIDKETSTLESAKNKMNRGQLDAAVVLPPSFGGLNRSGIPSGQLEVYYTQNNEQAASALQSVLQGEFQSVNAKYVKVEQPFSVVSKPLNIQGLSQFDYTFAGLLGFAIIGLGIFGPTNVFPELKKQGVLRRLRTTPLRVWQFFIANVISQMTIGLMSLTLMFVVAISIFHLHVTGNPIELIIFLIMSIAMIFGIGLSIGGWAKNERQAAPLTNIVVFPMMFLSGTFFPRFLMPEWLQHISAFLPLTPVIDGIRLLATEGKHLVDIAPQIGLIALWTVIIYVIAFRVFRWE
jgi:ABC-2 type transport system permease protein